MVAMADGGVEDWEYFGKTGHRGGRQLEVFSRKVDWSNVDQLKSVFETDEVTAHEFWEYLCARFKGTHDGIRMHLGVRSSVMTIMG